MSLSLVSLFEFHFIARAGEDKTITPDGSYSSGPRELLENFTEFGVETCLRASGSVESQQQRIRAIHNFRLVEGEWHLQTLEIHKVNPMSWCFSFE